MKVMVIVKATADSEAGNMPKEALLAEMGQFNADLAAAGIMIDGAGLKPSSQGARVVFNGNDRQVIDGPFAETKELVAGYWVLGSKVSGRSEGVGEALPHPMPGVDGAIIEIRPYFELDDFGTEYTPELQELEKQTQAMVDLRGTFTQPYLFFGGRCEEALDFYGKVLGAQVLMKMRFNESPQPPPPGFLEDGFETKIMHSTFKLGETTMMASDGCDSRSSFDGFRLAFQTKTTEQAEKAFAGLSEGGKVDMPLTKTFWSPLYGQVTTSLEWVGWSWSQPKSSPFHSPSGHWYLHKSLTPRPEKLRAPASHFSGRGDGGEGQQRCKSSRYSIQETRDQIANRSISDMLESEPIEADE